MLYLSDAEIGPVLLLAVSSTHWLLQSSINCNSHGHTGSDAHRLGVGTLADGVFG